MNKILTAIALSIALPAVAHAQSAPAAKMECCEKMKEKCDCCKDMAKMDHDKQGMKAGADPHAGHDMSKSSAPAPADAHKNHQN
ncbi:MAG: hypothetical protein ABIR25_01080 [Sphingomicrobium sp.]